MVQKKQKAFTFQTSPENVSYLTRNNIGICSVANNHSLDYGEESLFATLNILEKNNIKHIGTPDANQVILDINKKKVLLCSYYGNDDSISRINSKEIVDDIKRHKDESDYIIVCLHWGEEYVAYPSSKQQEMAHELIEAGASVVIGHHPHVFQGYEKYKEGKIFYSLGNFNFFVDHPYAKKLVETTKAYCVGLRFGETGVITHDIIPIHIDNDWRPSVIADILEIKRFRDYFEHISKPLEGRISDLFWYSEAAPHFFHNHIPSWKKRIKKYGFKSVSQMLIWLLHPSMYKYYCGIVLSLFRKRIHY